MTICVVIELLVIGSLGIESLSYWVIQFRIARFEWVMVLMT